MNREKVIEELTNVKEHLEMEGHYFAKAVSDVLDLLKEQEGIIASLKSDLAETLDVVAQQKNVVRCNECKHRDESNSPYWEIWCKRNDRSVDGDWFCADGELGDEA